MIKPDWNKFKAKFSENPQSNFEWFCYLLFCQEFNKPFGLFRYKNQSGIETSPIIEGKEEIGWQAKFYETTLSDHKDDLVGTINKSKRDYPNLSKIIFYTNQEWGQGRGQNDPKAKVVAEQTAKDSNIEIEWRTASFFESPFVVVDNEIIAQHFFNLDKSIISLLMEKQMHTESILYEIQTGITFNGERIVIDRSDLLSKVKEEIEKKQILILSGFGGVGKTAVIKELYEEQKRDTPFYIFKASEFELNNVNSLFGGFTLQDFIKTHESEKSKIIVIDSAEKLLDLQNTDPIKVFLSTLIHSDWKIIFTARSSYLSDLDMQFIDHYKIKPSKFYIDNLKQDELDKLSQAYKFNLPIDQKLIELIINPFYLNEYLKFYNKDEKIDYVNFKEKLWNRIIKKSKPNREQCFLQIAFQRVNEGQFFVVPQCHDTTLNSLVNDGILGYETTGYFITHDIYEEWALEKIIESEFIKKESNSKFFERIGASLPIRRSFRNWISEKLLLEDDRIKDFIEEIIEDENIAFFWKDESLISILLSDHSEYFIDLFKYKLLENEQKLLKRITFLVRIACKEVDNDFFKQIGLKNINLFSIKYVLTKPKGKGWESLIKFVYENLCKIGVENITFILPIINDWNTKFKEGETTKFASLIALKYYQSIIKAGSNLSRDNDIKEKLFQTILYGASEVKEELICVFDEVLKNKWKNYRDPYYELIKAILTKIGDNIEVIRSLPEYIIKLANLFWLNTSKKSKTFSSSIGIEKDFCIEENRDYNPSSAYQTPIYWLLQYSLKNTIDFILSFTNETVEYYSKSASHENEVKVIEVAVNHRLTKQYISNRLWNTYRGTQGSPRVLESIHMALEKFFLEISDTIDSKKLESYLLYLLKNSKSASITAVVVSIVLAYPEKTFNVAKILFQTKEFFLYDTSRMVLDQTAKSQYLIGYGLVTKNKIYEDERIKACAVNHRKNSLEHLILIYQLFKGEDFSKEEVENRQKVIWSILDKYYEELEHKSKETDDDKTWRLYLARVDSRKMKPSAEEKDGKVLISFNPEIDPELKEFSETSIKKSYDSMKYNSVKLWASYRIRNDEQYKQYVKYENNPKLALKEIEEVLEKFKNKDETFYLFNHAIPADVCSVLVRDYEDQLSENELEFCKNIILEAVLASFRDNYTYQIWDGVESAISVLPILLNKFPEEKGTIKAILLVTLFNSMNVGMYCEFSDYSSRAILNHLWGISFEDAQSILFGYLILKPEYEAVREELWEEKYKKNIHSLYENEVIEKFMNDYETDLDRVIDNKITFDTLKNIEQLDLYILKTAFQLIPLKTDNVEHKKIGQSIISAFTKVLLSNDRTEKVDYTVSQNFLEKFAYIVLCSSKQDIPYYLNPFLDNLNNSEYIANLLQEFILAEDKLNTYDNFWLVWNLFFERIVKLCKDGDEYWYVGKIIKSYLFAQTPWNETTKDWRALKDDNKRFFRNVAKNIGHCPSALYSISKLLNDVGSKYLDNGISWISGMLRNNSSLWNSKLEINTIYYLENLIKQYIFKDRERIRKIKKLQQEVLVILDFLVEKGSVVGYLLRENVL
ncbi:ATPase [Bacillus toyonensis]|uniref:AVAST type 4 anti-phage nuclease Avs4 n=1 Tax=Bacillus toyonensis TaxID=155322 RepID=UPI000BF52868|nr:AVAST type 4 anti-phage nuclease Avs4 [Bacillus toyonensis]PFY14563.1 ATPase [Bacillus toyonensis]